MLLDTKCGHSLDELRVHLTEAVAWVGNPLANNASHSLRRSVTRPPFFLDAKSTVDRACRQRSRCLGYPPASLASSLEAGRCLVYVPADSLSDGAASLATGGFFDDDNVPPWDTWIAYLCESPTRQYLVSWIPAGLVKSVHHGIDVNPEGCIYWLDERESDVRNQLEAIGLVYER